MAAIYQVAEVSKILRVCAVPAAGHYNARPMLEFVLPPDANLDELARRLIDGLRLEQGEESIVERSWYDTFDWRLDRQGFRLVGEPCDGGLQLSYRPSDADGEPPARLRLEVAPRFAWDLPPSALREAIEEWVEMRALTAVATVRTVVRPLVKRDGNDKIVARLAIEASTVAGPKGPLPIAPRIQLLPLRGYGKAATRALRFITEELALSEPSQDQLSAALEPLGREIGDYSSKPAVELEPTQRADDATKRILLQLLNIMERNIDGVCEQLDTEFLHDFRVAVRRSRSALARIRRVFPAPIVGRFQRELRWLGQLTGTARDLDVYLLQFDRLCERVAEPRRAALEPLRPRLQARHAEAYREVVEGLRSPRCSKLLAGWRAFLAAPVPKRSRLDNAQRAVLDVARDEIWRAYRRVLEDGGAITEASPSTDLHELRKSCKKLRYLLEFFRRLFPKPAVSALIAELKALQENLGAINDFEVQASEIEAMSKPLSAEVSAETLMAIGALVEQLRRAQDAGRRDFAGVFNRFALKRNRKMARSLFKSKASASEGAP